MRSSWTRQILHSDHRNTADARLISHLIYRNTLWFQYAILSPPSAASTYTQRLSWNALPVSCAEVQQRFWGCFECFEVTLRRVESFQHRQATDVSCPFIQIQPSSPAYQNQTQNLHIYMNTVQLLLADVPLSKKKESGSKMRHLIVRTSVTFISRFPKSRSHSTLFCFIKRNFKLRSWSSHVTLAHFLFQQPITQTSAILSDPTALPPNSLWVAAYYTAHGGDACSLFIGDWEKHVARRNSITLRPLI